MGTRPLYETEADVSREAKVAHWLARRWKRQAVQLPKRYAVDYALVDPDGELTDWLEVKCRTNPMAQYPTYMLSAEKYWGMVRLQEASNRPVRLVVRWTDAVGVLSVPCGHQLSFGGRVDRGDRQDREPVVLFPIDSFEIVFPAPRPIEPMPDA